MHCWFARSEPGLQAGGFLGDFIKGRLADKDCPEELKQGLRLHRHIDHVSNKLPSLRISYTRFGDALRRPAPVLTDLIADHIFAKYWDRYGEGTLTDFTAGCYHSIGQYSIPESAQRMYGHMLKTDLFASYAELEVMEDIMQRILKRLRFGHLAEELTAKLRSQEDALVSDFDRYFYELESCANTWISEHCTTKRFSV